MQLGLLTFRPVKEVIDLVATPVRESLEQNDLYSETWAAPIDPQLADTAAFCAQYQIGMEVSANCVIVEAKRGERVWYAACVILATSKADVNGIVRRHLDARKLSFAPMATAVSLAKMEYGGITPIGLPEDWPVLVDKAILGQENVIIGSGVRGSKLLVATTIFNKLPGASVMEVSKPQ